MSTAAWICLSTVLTDAIHAMLYVYIMYHVLELKKVSRALLAAIFFGCMVIAAAVFMLPISTLYKALLEGGWCAACLSWYYRIPFKLSLVVAVCHELAITLWRYLLSVGYGVLFDSALYMVRSNIRSIVSEWTITAIVLGLIAYLVRRPGKTVEEAFMRAFIRLNTVGLFGAVLIQWQSRILLLQDRAAMWTIVASILLAVTIMLREIHRGRIIQDMADTERHYADQLKREYHLLLQSYEKNARLFHDMHHHIGAIQELLDDQHYEAARQYLAELQPDQPAANSRSGNTVVDYILNLKAEMAGEYGVRLEMQVDFPNRTTLRDGDLCAVLSNLLDNALEAARRVSDPSERWVRLTIRPVHHILVIKVVNRFEEPPVVNNGRLKSQKPDVWLHGWGLRNAAEAAEKYDGVVRTHFDAGIFKAVATMNFDCRPELTADSGTGDAAPAADPAAAGAFPVRVCRLKR